VLLVCCSDMGEDSDKCSDALCDGMKLYAKGDIMTYTHVSASAAQALSHCVSFALFACTQ
jgi:hypothetical protein